ncbi:MAG: NAD(+) diphosphatase [Actinomycetota bacterium]|nr:NAD(+) diphosphatase [Actinomycetota bacterium]
MASFNPSLLPPDAAGRHRYIHVIGATVFIDDRPADASWAIHFLGMLDDEACWAVDVPHGEDPSYGAALDLYSLYGRTSEPEWAVAGRAVQLAEWARTHRFCGRCATPTEPSAGDRSMKCPACGLLAYPRLAPAMITLVTRGEAGPEQEVLLARGVQFRAPMYSCLAGFVEPGESLEGAVVREVFEEVGVEVGNVQYRGSQPWPFPHSLMIGFRAEWQRGDIVCDPSEIVDAQWYTREALPPIPPAISIARRLIDDWLAESAEAVSFRA